MLVGANRKPGVVRVVRTESILDRMESSCVEFFLTGSRYFGWTRPDSDWDFFALDEGKARSTLNLLGFVEDTGEGYKDDLTRKVFRWSSHLNENSVHVQLVTSLLTKHELNRFFLLNKRLLAIPCFGKFSENISWTPRSKEVQRSAWLTAVTMALTYKRDH